MRKCTIYLKYCPFYNFCTILISSISSATYHVLSTHVNRFITGRELIRTSRAVAAFGTESCLQRAGRMQVEQTQVHSQCENELGDNWQSVAVVPLVHATHQYTIMQSSVIFLILLHSFRECCSHCGFQPYDCVIIHFVE